ncbi:MAG: DNA polymerase III subunit alpha [Planctomycetes bacterium]|nr:DNA polymerase III subunit alpha [Planctomycetota bacterium]
MGARIAEEDAGLAVLSADADWLEQLARNRGADHLYATTAACAQVTRLPLIAAPEVVAADRVDLERHRLLRAVGGNTSLSSLSERRCASPHAHLKDMAALRLEAGFDESAWHRARELSERAEYHIPLGQKRMPCFPVPGGRTAQAQLALLCQRGLRRRRIGVAGPNGAAFPLERYQAQMHRELALIAEQGFSDYFLVVADLVRWSRGRGIQCCGRGSAANSLVSWLLGCTHVDPIAEGLWFERFMNTGREDFPDIDLDFAWDERDEVLAYAMTRWGKDRLAVIATHNTFAARGAVRELAKVCGVPEAEIGPVTRALPWRGGSSLDLDALCRNPHTRDLALDAEPWRTILKQASALDGFPRHTGVHPGGTVLAPSPLTDHMPLQHARKSTSAGPLTTTQWDMYAVEEAGFVKIDLLGNRGLSVIRDAAKMVQKNTSLPIDLAHLQPTRDTATRRMLARGDTMGCFYVESPGMRGLLRKLGCADFPTLVAASSIIRPGISQSGMMRAYIERHRAVAQSGGVHDPAWYLHPEMRPLLKETYGVMTYQEDVMKIASNLAGFDPGEADRFRRSMARKRADRSFESWGPRFLKGLRERGMEDAVAQELWRQVESFSGYSFCKAHSASYAQVSFRSVWLRAHFPAEFMAAVLRNHGGFYSTFAYVAEARRMGLDVKLPSVNHSQNGFTGGNGTVRVGLDEIEQVSRSAGRRLLAERARHGPFASQEDLCARLLPTASDLKSWVRAGALDDLSDGWTRPERMRSVALWQRQRGSAQVAEHSLFGSEPSAVRLRRPPAGGPYERRTELLQEWEALGFLVSAHPLSLYADAIRSVDALPARDLMQHVGKRVRLVGWQVTQKPVRTQDGKPMLFLSFEDTTALYETVMWPRAYKRLAPWTLTRGPYVIEGIPRAEENTLTLEVADLRLLEPLNAAQVP